ncbi:hypothetical protein Tco_0407119 [Tanacetum coccineum]
MEDVSIGMWVEQFNKTKPVEGAQFTLDKQLEGSTGDEGDESVVQITDEMQDKVAVIIENADFEVAGELLKQYKDKSLMNTYLSQSNPVTTRWEEEDHLRDSKFQLDSFRETKIFSFWIAKNESVRIIGVKWIGVKRS